jgi:uncharacterized membrane protein
MLKARASDVAGKANTYMYVGGEMHAGSITFAILMGLALAASAGLRAFLPPLTVSLLSWGGYITLAPGFEWLARPEVALVFGVAAVLEIIGDKYPGVDHFLDAAGLVVRPLAGALVASSLITGMDPVLSLCLGIVVGAGAAGTVSLAKAKLRLLSSGLTAGLGNPVLSLLEDGASLTGTFLGVVVPALSGLLVLGGLGWLLALLLKHGRQRQPGA